jgi:hypothetical protein
MAEPGKTRLKRDDLRMNYHRALGFWFAHDLIGKPLHTFADHALTCGHWLAEIGMVLAGIGMGINTGPLMGVGVAAVEAARSGTASSLINVARMVGATLGVAVLGALYALLGGGPTGFTAALAIGGSVQLIGAATAWATVPETALR